MKKMCLVVMLCFACLCGNACDFVYGVYTNLRRPKTKVTGVSVQQNVPQIPQPKPLRFKTPDMPDVKLSAKKLQSQIQNATAIRRQVRNNTEKAIRLYSEIISLRKHSLEYLQLLDSLDSLPDGAAERDYLNERRVLLEIQEGLEKAWVHIRPVDVTEASKKLDALKAEYNDKKYPGIIAILANIKRRVADIDARMAKAEVMEIE